MNIFVLGSGAREHSICWALKKSQNCKKLFCSPGNAGIEKIAICENIDLRKKEKVLHFCRKQSIDLVVIGPEDFLASGLSDYLIENGVRTFGPTKKASKLETSKSFAKSFLKKNGISTPVHQEFDSYSKALIFLKKANFPLVIKADGLAAGKGVIICKNINDASRAITDIMRKKIFGSAGEKIIVEEFITGFEISYFAFVDKKTFLPLGYALDHKRAYDNDKGPNTGGMGCFTPSRLVTNNLEKKIIKNVVKKTLTGLKKEKFTYRGILFFGLMIKNEEPYVIEYNVRFGDPECQTLLRNLNSDFLELLLSTTNDELSEIKISHKKKSVVCVVLASKGYPGTYKTEKVINNLNKVANMKDIEIFHAGTKSDSAIIKSNGGRVLSITATGNNIDLARSKAYKAVKTIEWEDGFYRNDIGIKNI